MVSPITITNKKTNKTYTLEFNRKAIEAMERQGFDISSVASKPMTMIPALFRGAFVMNHPTVKKETIDDIYACLPNKSGLLEKLIELYNEPIMALVSNDEENEGNGDWGASY